MSIKKKQFHKNEVIVESCKRAKEGNGRLHLLGLVSVIALCRTVAVPTGSVDLLGLACLGSRASPMRVGETWVHSAVPIGHYPWPFPDVVHVTTPLTADVTPQVSDGGVHSHIRHLFALLETAKEQGVPHVYIHFFGDGRDTAPRSAAGYAKELLEFIEKEKIGEIATVVGRYYAMDRDKRWERIKIAFDGLVGGVGEEGKDVVKAIEERYKKDETDEFLKPIIVNGDEGRIKGMPFTCTLSVTVLMCALSENDTLFLFNYRSDRMREIATILGQLDKPIDISVPKNLVCAHDVSTGSDVHINDPANKHNVAIQRRVPLPRCLPASGDDQRPR